MASFGALALLLAALGIYGMVSYTATLRSRELAIRKALGAVTRDIFLLVMKQGVMLALIGLSIGLAGALALLRLLRGLVFGVPAYNLALLAGVLSVLLLVALFAVYIPARRAANLEPMLLLRSE
jgi:putative ABC transport system permease protein